MSAIDALENVKFYPARGAKTLRARKICRGLGSVEDNYEDDPAEDAPVDDRLLGASWETGPPR
jgi:hypothetical protein